MENLSNKTLTVDAVNIGVFDSGIGGFSILKEIHRLLPQLEVHYIADDAFAPYGTKSREEIIERSKKNTLDLLARGAQLIVVACNSATAAAIEELRLSFPQIPFVGVEPYLNALNHPNKFPGIERAGVITTVLTGKSEKFVNLKKRLDPEGKIFHLALPHLAGLIEELYERGMSSELKTRIVEEITPVRSQGLSHLILGCTHYPLIASLIEEVLDLQTISPCPYVANRVLSLLTSMDLLSDAHQAKEQFFFRSTKSLTDWQQYNFSSLSLLD